MIRQYLASRNSQRKRTELKGNAHATVESFGNPAPSEKSPKFLSKRMRGKSVDSARKTTTTTMKPKTGTKTRSKSASRLSAATPSSTTESHSKSLTIDQDEDDFLMDRLPLVSEKEHRLISSQLIPLDPTLEAQMEEYAEPQPLPPSTKQRSRRAKRTSSLQNHHHPTTRYDSTHLKQTLEALTTNTQTSSFQQDHLVYQQSSTGHRYDATPEKPAAVSQNTNSKAQSSTNKYGLMRIIDSESESEDEFIFGNHRSPQYYDSSTDEEGLSSRNHRAIARKKTPVVPVDPQQQASYHPGNLYTKQSPQANNHGLLWDLYADDSSSGYSSVDDEEGEEDRKLFGQKPPQQQQQQQQAPQTSQAVVVNIRQKKPLSVQVEERPPTPPQSPPRKLPQATAVVISTKRYKQSTSVTSSSSPSRTSNNNTPKSKISAKVKNAAASIGGNSVRSSPSTRGSSRPVENEDEIRQVPSCPVSVDDDDDEDSTTGTKDSNGTATKLFMNEISGSVSHESVVSPLASPAVGAFPGTPSNEAVKVSVNDTTSQSTPKTTTSKTKSLESSQSIQSTSSLKWSDRLICTAIFVCGVLPCMGTWYYFNELVIARPLRESVLLVGCNALTLICCITIILEIVYRSKTHDKPSKYGSSTSFLRQPFQLVRKGMKLRRRIKKEESRKASLQSKILAASANERLLKRRTELLERISKTDQEIAQRQKEAVVATTFESLIEIQEQNPKRKLKASRNPVSLPTSSGLGKIRSASPQARTLKSRSSSLDSAGSAASGSSGTSHSSLMKLLGSSGRDKAMEVIPQRLARIPGVTIEPSPLWRQRQTTIADIFRSVLAVEKSTSPSPAHSIISYQKPARPHNESKDSI